MLSIVLVVPASLVDLANSLGDALGWGPENFSVPLSGTQGISHYGLHTWASETFVQMVQARAVPEPAFLPVLDALTMSVRTSSSGHFGEVIRQLGLHPFAEE